MARKIAKPLPKEFLDYARSLPMVLQMRYNAAHQTVLADPKVQEQLRTHPDLDPKLKQQWIDNQAGEVVKQQTAPEIMAKRKELDIQRGEFTPEALQQAFQKEKSDLYPEPMADIKSGEAVYTPNPVVGQPPTVTYPTVKAGQERDRLAQEDFAKHDPYLKPFYDIPEVPQQKPPPAPSPRPVPANPSSPILPPENTGGSETGESVPGSEDMDQFSDKNLKTNIQSGNKSVEDFLTKAMKAYRKK